MTTRVLLVSHAPDHLAARLGACPGIRLVATVADVEASLERASRHSADVALVDLALPDGGPVAATAAVLAVRPRCAVALVAPDERAVPRHTDALIAALQAGARGYLLATAAPAELAAAIDALAAGGPAITPDLARDLVTAFDWSWTDALAAGRPSASRPLGRLQPEERQALLLVGLGLSHAEIAARCRRTEPDVRHTLRHLLDRLRPAPGDPPDTAGARVPRRPPPGGLIAGAAARPEDGTGDPDPVP